MKSPEAPREPVIPATASRGLAPVGGAGDLQTAAVAGSPGPAAPSSDATPPCCTVTTESHGTITVKLEGANDLRDGWYQIPDDAMTTHGHGRTEAGRSDSGGYAIRRRSTTLAEKPGVLSPSYRKPQRRELSYPLAALAYTWAAVCRRGRL